MPICPNAGNSLQQVYVFLNVFVFLFPTVVGFVFPSASAITGGTSLQQGSSSDCLRPFHATTAGLANLALKNTQVVFLFVVYVYVEVCI